MDAGCYVQIRFNHRIMRLFWLSGYLLWEGYCAYQHYSLTGKTNIKRFRELLACFESTCTAANVDDVPWPAGIPQPGNLVKHTPENSARVSGELAIIATGWAFLHELQHIMHQQQGTAAPHGDEVAGRAEEHTCDQFATEFLLDQIATYARDRDENGSIVNAKRQTGIYCALFAITLIAKNNWTQSATHPAVQCRIDKIVELMRAHGMSKMAAIIAVAAFTTLKLAYTDAPNPVEAICEVIERENWTPVDELF